MTNNHVSHGSEATVEKSNMVATGQFELKLEPQKDEGSPAGRMIINKTYSGGLIGTAVGQMISKRTESGVAVYYAIEEFSGSVDGKDGSFTLLHNGRMDKESQSLEVIIMENTGTKELENISGSMTITIEDDGTHLYELTYSL